ncbi:helix-turn-helix domain-containing protein [Ancylobacter oerskovii]|uniref:Helix-turn-helix domain-containing protein n=1 Tax=Ancylobacter oerskovii TaxID=459519 RepID=A0ABW4YSR9_9HYPH|nr:AraC family transcriptional regulator [Ancylobacter oerskovii]MBS7545309.1 helix-turn-helix transcriptional regulator [Ancylobacter oerskovii]
MSFHVSPPAEGSVSPARAVEILSVPFDAPRPVAPVAPPAAPDSLSVRLGHIDLVLAISAASAFPGTLAPVVEPAAARDGTLHLRVAGSHLPAALGLAGPAVAGTDDPVIRRLSQALEAAEHGADEFGGVYADALRLAIVTRALSVRPGDAPEPRERDPETAPSPRRPRSGLPKWRLKKALAYIDDNLAESVTLAGMADAAGLSRMHFAAQFRIATGLRPHEFLLRRRIEKAQALMLETRDSLVAIALDVGFQTQAHFTTVFRRFVGDTPHQWRSAQRGRN